VSALFLNCPTQKKILAFNHPKSLLTNTEKLMIEKLMIKTASAPILQFAQAT